eukprot:5235390-Heterocapsa_arctica.AAC.1
MGKSGAPANQGWQPQGKGQQYQQQAGWIPNQGGGQGFNFGPAQPQQFWGPGAAQWGPPAGTW